MTSTEFDDEPGTEDVTHEVEALVADASRRELVEQLHCELYDIRRRLVAVRTTALNASKSYVADRSSAASVEVSAALDWIERTLRGEHGTGPA